MLKFLVMPHKGYKRTKEHCKALSLSHIGLQAKEKHPMWGKHLSEETKRKISLTKIGKPSWSKGKSQPNLQGEKSGRWKGGKPRCITCDKLLSDYHVKYCKKHYGLRIVGEKNSHWKGGITPENWKIRKSSEYKLWRKAVFGRDSYTCVWCKVKGNGKNLNADHIKPFSLFPELRFAIDNGRTLCVECHRKTDTYGWKSYHKARSIL